MQINKKNKLEELKKKIDKIESSKNKTIIKKKGKWRWIWFQN